ncbi:MAG: hypothetical protein Q9198_008595 [Flavoplaca austrocitrina]
MTNSIAEIGTSDPYGTDETAEFGAIQVFHAEASVLKAFIHYFQQLPLLGIHGNCIGA